MFISFSRTPTVWSARDTLPRSLSHTIFITLSRALSQSLTHWFTLLLFPLFLPCPSGLSLSSSLLVLFYLSMSLWLSEFFSFYLVLSLLPLYDLSHSLSLSFWEVYNLIRIRWKFGIRWNISNIIIYTHMYACIYVCIYVLLINTVELIEVCLWRIGRKPTSATILQTLS